MKYKNVLLFILMFLFVAPFITNGGNLRAQNFPDGSPVPGWFSDTSIIPLSALGKQYALNDYEVKSDSMVVQTEKIQAIMDKAS